MSLDPTVSAIIGGCVGGGVLLVAIIALVIFFVCRGRRKRKKTFSQLSTSTSVQTSPSQSQPSSLGPGADGARLPKVSSNGLWLGNPSMYSGAPPPAYLYGRPSSKQEAEHLAGLHPSSEKRTQKPVLVPPLFSTGTPRIYHSQQLVPVIEELNSNTAAVYQFQGSGAHLLDDGYPNGHLQRRHSDAIPGSQSRSADQKHSSKTRSATNYVVQVHDIQSKSTGMVGKGHTNLAFTPDVVHGELSAASAREQHKMPVVTSATDSMKMLAKNKTDDQKQVGHALTSSFAPEPEVKPAHFVHADNVYSLPQKTDGQLGTSDRQSLDNPILACMQAMDLDRTDSMSSLFGHVAGSMLLQEDLACTVPVIHNPLYEEADDVATSVHDVSAAYQKAGGLPSYQKQHSASDQIQGSTSEQIQGSASDHIQNSASDHIQKSASDHIQNSASDHIQGIASDNIQDSASDQKQHNASVANESSKGMQASTSDSVFPELCARKSESTPDNCYRVDDAISRQRQGSMDAEDGKHITAAAFEFLDNYLSDDESNDFHSPPTSPFISAHGNHNY